MDNFLTFNQCKILDIGNQGCVYLYNPHFRSVFVERVSNHWNDCLCAKKCNNKTILSQFNALHAFELFSFSTLFKLLKRQRKTPLNLKTVEFEIEPSFYHQLCSLMIVKKCNNTKRVNN